MIKQNIFTLLLPIAILLISGSKISASEYAQKQEQWRRMTTEEEAQTWHFILNSPLGIAALNRLAIEGFISPVCSKTFYIDEQYGGFKTLLQVKCPEPRGVSTAVSYDEMRVIFNRFEDNIENFAVERVHSENRGSVTPLPE